MRREVIATVAIAVGVILLGVAGYLLSIGKPFWASVVVTGGIVLASTLLAFGSIKVHR